MRKLNDLNFTHSEEIKLYSSHCAEISILIINYMRTHNMDRLEFSEFVNESLNTIGDWISLCYNFDVYTISVIESKLGIKLINKLTQDQIDTYLEGKPFK